MPAGAGALAGAGAPQLFSGGGSGRPAPRCPAPAPGSAVPAHRGRLFLPEKKWEGERQKGNENHKMYHL